MRTPRKDSSAGTPFLRIFRAPATGHIGVTLVSPKLEEWATHHAGGSDRVCGRELGRECPACDAGVNPRRSIYALAVEWSAKQLGIVHITSGAYEHCEQLRQLADDCRGVSLKLSRLRPVTNSPARIQVMPERVPSGRLPLAGDILRRGLGRLWQATPEDLAVMLAAVDEAELPDVAELAADQPAPDLPDMAELAAAPPAADPPAAPDPVIRVTSRARPGFVRWERDERGQLRVAELGGVAAEFPELVPAAGPPVELPDVAAQVAAQVEAAGRAVEQAAAAAAAGDLAEMRRMLREFANGTTMPRSASPDN